MIRNITVFLTVVALLGILYILFPIKFPLSSGSSDNAAGTESVEDPAAAGPNAAASAADASAIQVGPRVFHNVKVTRRDADGFLITSREGMLKLWNRDLTPEVYLKLKAASPESTPTPAPASNTAHGLMQDHSLMGASPTPRRSR